MKETKRKSKYSKIISSWGDEDFCRDFEKKIDLWLAQFEKTEQETMLLLLKNFTFYSEKRVRLSVTNMFKNFSENYPNWESEKTVFAHVQKDFGVGFSQLFADAFWLSNNLYSHMEQNVCGLIENSQIPETLCVVDDYCGSGGTFKKFLNKLIGINSEIKQSKIVLLVLHITEIGKVSLLTYAKSQNIDLDIIDFENSKQVFENELIFSKRIAMYEKEKYQEVCQRFNLKFDLGYKEIQSLVSFYYNTPNNTLGVFWEELDGFVNLFKRHKKMQTQLRDMQNKARQNEHLMRQKPFINDVEEYQYNIFLVYCVAKGRAFSLLEACKDFGFTEQQLTETLKYLSDSGYIT